jgi:NitT/TauT family transport system ATP-binding protein
MESRGPGVVEVCGLRKTFVSEGGRASEALGDVSFSCRAGELVCILGPSGCGKTTLLRLIAGLEKRSGGTVLIDGASIDEPRPVVGMVFQEGILFPWRSVDDNVAFGLEVRGMRRKERLSRSKAILELVDLPSEVGSKKPYELSVGMQQRVAIARALCTHPEILLMDEPFASVDEVTRWKLQDELLRIWQRSGTTILFVTHNIEEAAYLAQRILLMVGPPGRIERELAMGLPYPRARTGREFGLELLDVRSLFQEIVLERSADAEAPLRSAAGLDSRPPGAPRDGGPMRTNARPRR